MLFLGLRSGLVRNAGWPAYGLKGLDSIAVQQKICEKIVCTFSCKLRAKQVSGAPYVSLVLSNGGRVFKKNNYYSAVFAPSRLCVETIFSHYSGKRVLARSHARK